jgi:hypothetical protein
MTALWVSDGDFTNLRSKCFSMTGPELSCGVNTDEAAPWGVIMEIGHPDMVLTIAAFLDGTVSVLRSTGVHYVGGELATSIRRAGQWFLKQAAQVQTNMHRTMNFALPEIGQVCFYFRTDYGVYATEVLQQDLNSRRSEMTALFYAGLCILHEYLLVQGPPSGT